MVKWLDDEEMAAWRSMIEVNSAVMAALEAESVERHGIAEGDYAVLVNLSEAPDERLRMCDLASALHLSPSGITRRLDGMVKQGLVVREPSTEDRRVMLAVLTPVGRAKLDVRRTRPRRRRASATSSITSRGPRSATWPPPSPP